MIHVTDVWRKAHPGASLGFMIVDQLRNDLPCTLLEETKENLEKQLKSAFESKEKTCPNLAIGISYQPAFLSCLEIFNNC